MDLMAGEKRSLSNQTIILTHNIYRGCVQLQPFWHRRSR